jgi:metallophosphoesterase superfamily enzyme
MTLTVINDWHLGAVRSGGTTPATAYQLRQDLLANGQAILDQTTGDLLVNGDLFDDRDIPRADLLAAVRMFAAWLTDHPNSHLWLANGNHDLDKNSTKLSSFQLFAQLLHYLFPERVEHITKGTHLPEHDAYVIPHMPNQELFDLELGRVPECRYLFVHANYDNQFAVEMDHSLNLPREQAEWLPVEYIVFGHEHQARTELGGKVVIVGNQFPSSVSDCLGPSDKYLLEIEGGKLQFHQTWDGTDFVEVDWREIADHGARFVRVTGTASAEEANKVVNAIARLRRDSSALVITNAVKVAGVADGEEMQLTHEEVTNFNAMEALLEFLGPEDGAELTKIMEEENA